MLYVGRPGLWNDWQKFQAEARKARIEAQEEAQRKRQQLLETIVLSAAIIVGIGFLGIVIYVGLKARGML